MDFINLVISQGMGWGLEGNAIGKGLLTPSDLVTRIDIKQSNLIHQWKALNNIKHFTAHDVISRWNIVSVYSRATAITAALFLDTLEKRVPFPVKAIQVDGGSEFEAVFQEECQRHGINLFVLPPRSPKLNGAVKRAHRTHTEEFYEVTEGSFDLSDLREELLEWEQVYNTVRPHQALGYVTPLEFLEQRKEYSGKEVMCH